MSKNAVAEVKNTALVDDSAMGMFEGLEGAGFGETNASDFVIPRIGLIGALSPQLKKGNAKYLEDADEGDLADVALNEILVKGITDEGFLPFLPVRRIKEVIQWKPRTAGGGIVKREPLTVRIEDYAAKVGAVQNDKFEWKLPNGDEIIETWQLYGIDLLRNMPVFIPFKKSNLKIIRPWFTARANWKGKNNKPYPLFAKTVNIGSFMDSGNGNEWANFKIVDGTPLPALENANELLQSAKDFLEILESGAYVAEVDNDDHEEDTPF